MNDKCYLCKSDDLQTLKGSVRDNANLNMLKCKNCTLAFLDNFNHITTNFYKSGNMLPKNLNIALWEKRAYKDDLRRFKFLKKSVKNKTLIDFGAGAGGFIKLANTVTKDCYAIELDDRLRNYISKQNLKVFDCIESCPKVDIITLFHTLEHIKDPISFLSDLKKHLCGNESEIIIEIPNLNDALISLYKLRAFLNFTWWSCHLFAYNSKTITQIAKKAGYKINYIKRIQRYGIVNHLYWFFKGKPGGERKHPEFNNDILDYIYGKILAVFDKTDTLFISISPE